MKWNTGILLLWVWCMTGCITSKQPAVEKTYNNQVNNISFTYLALGDSYTIGHDVPEEKRYPVQLAHSLQQNGFIPATVQVIARTGWTTDELSAAMDQAVFNDPYDLVTLLIGVNNQYRGRSADNYSIEFTSLLKRAIMLAGENPSRVIVLSIPDWGVTPFARERDTDKISSEIDSFNSINRQISIELGVLWLDVTAVSREAAHNHELLAPDGLHPSGLMYQYWTSDLYPLAVKVLTQ
jgi:lysophospholipase L1-like esterase